MQIADDGPVESGEISFRPHIAVRVYMVVFFTVWTGILLPGFVSAVAAGTPAALIPLGMLGLGDFIGYRLFNVSVVGTRDALIIRNSLSTKRIPKEQVEGFRIGAISMGVKAVVALLHDDTVVSLDATAQTFRGQRQLDAAVSDLRAWLAR